MRRWLDRIFCAIAAAALCALMLLIVGDVLLRNLAHRPLLWGTELTELLMGTLSFAAFVPLALRMGHIAVELLPMRPGSRAARAVAAAGALGGAAVFGLIAWQARHQALRSGRNGETMAQLGLSLSWVWWAVFVLSLVVVLASLMAAVDGLNGRIAHHDITEEAV